MSGSQSDHQRAWDHMEAMKEFRVLVDKHFRRIRADGGTIDEIDALADDFRAEIDWVLVPFHAARNRIHKYMRTGGKIGDF